MRTPLVFATSVCLFLSAFVFDAPVFAEGPKTLKIGDVELVSNGSGYRKKALFSLYEGTLYLQKRSSNSQAIIAADAPMAIRIQITSGFVSQQKMVEALDEGFKNSTGGNTQAFSNQIKQFRGCFSDPIKKQDVFVLYYAPESGVTVHKNGKLKGQIAGADFKKAVFGIWLSDQPADASLKTAMLGK